MRLQAVAALLLLELRPTVRPTPRTNPPPSFPAVLPVPSRHWSHPPPHSPQRRPKPDSAASAAHLPAVLPLYQLAPISKFASLRPCRIASHLHRPPITGRRIEEATNATATVGLLGVVVTTVPVMANTAIHAPIRHATLPVAVRRLITGREFSFLLSSESRHLYKIIGYACCPNLSNMQSRAVQCRTYRWACMS